MRLLLLMHAISMILRPRFLDEIAQMMSTGGRMWKEIKEETLLRYGDLRELVRKLRGLDRSTWA